MTCRGCRHILRRLVGIEPLNITDQVRYRFLGFVIALMMLDALVPAAHQAVGLPQPITMTLQVLTWIGTLLAFVWAVILANRPKRPGDKER